MIMDFSRLGMMIPEILLPDAAIELAKWPVVACDQYTSQLEYWEELARLIGEAPSTLHLIFPEVYLGEAESDARIARIQSRMSGYLNEGVLKELGPGFILVERELMDGRVRKGLMIAVDLEAYDFNAGAQVLIRSTEETVLERIPPRVKVRRGAPLELPHIMLLIDDPGRQVIEPLAGMRARLPKLYETDLLMDGGTVTGYHVAGEMLFDQVYAGLRELADTTTFNRRYGLRDAAPLLFAVGDGNHSLATAKTVWEELKSQGADPGSHPARYALAELVNLHDPSLQFEPIHRIVFQAEIDKLLQHMQAFYNQDGCRYEWVKNARQMDLRLAVLRKAAPASHVIGLVSGGRFGVIQIDTPRHSLEVGTLQLFLDEWAGKHSEAELDYIHGEAVLLELAAQPGNSGFLLPVLAKGDLFKTVIRDGVLPRKSFSLGEAEEKRFYMECRRIG
jgi:hypothetical protein